MPINPDAVGSTTEPAEGSWTSKDCLLYALGVGAGMADPTGFELEFTTENSQDVSQRVLPTFAVVAGAGGGGAFAKIGSFNPAMLVHGEQTVELHSPLPVEGRISSVTTITGIYDKGSGAVIALESVSSDSSTGRRCSRPARHCSFVARVALVVTGGLRARPNRRRATRTTR